MKFSTIAITCLIAQQVFTQNTLSFLKHYKQKNVERITLPVGGIETGNIVFGGHGQWKHVEILNNPGVESGNHMHAPGWHAPPVSPGATIIFSEMIKDFLSHPGPEVISCPTDIIGEILK